MTIHDPTKFVRSSRRDALWGERVGKTLWGGHMQELRGDFTICNSSSSGLNSTEAISEYLRPSFHSQNINLPNVTSLRWLPNEEFHTLFGDISSVYLWWNAVSKQPRPAWNRTSKPSRVGSVTKTGLIAKLLDLITCRVSSNGSDSLRQQFLAVISGVAVQTKNVKDRYPLVN